MRASLLALGLMLAPALAAKEPTPKAEQFIDRSNILFPAVVEGNFKVESHDQDPGVFGGVSIAFEEPPFVPRSRFTISAYVYPIGRMETERALAAGVSHIVEGVKGQEEYTDVRIEPAAPYEVEAPKAPPLSEGPRGRQKIIGLSDAPASKPAATDADLAAALTSWTPDGKTPGRRVLMHFNTKGSPVRSVGYVFYRQMMLVKIRITAAADGIPKDAFNLHADLAANAIAPAFEIQNFGNCGVLYLPDAPDKDKDASDGKAGGLALVEEMGRAQRENCVVAEGTPDPVAEGMIRHTLVYPKDTWN
jgi:hypothetical protein